MESYEVDRLLRAAERQLGSIEMVIYCVAKSEPVMFLSSDLDKFKSHMEQNFFCAIKFLLPIANKMSMNKTHGRICIIGDPLAS
jgi:short-subunit dehydrogenase